MTDIDLNIFRASLLGLSPNDQVPAGPVIAMIARLDRAEGRLPELVDNSRQKVLQDEYGGFRCQVLKSRLGWEVVVTDLQTGTSLTDALPAFYDRRSYSSQVHTACMELWTELANRLRGGEGAD